MPLIELPDWTTVEGRFQISELLLAICHGCLVPDGQARSGAIVSEYLVSKSARVLGEDKTPVVRDVYRGLFEANGGGRGVSDARAFSEIIALFQANHTSVWIAHGMLDYLRRAKSDRGDLCSVNKGALHLLECAATHLDARYRTSAVKNDTEIKRVWGTAKPVAHLCFALMNLTKGADRVIDKLDPMEFGGEEQLMTKMFAANFGNMDSFMGILGIAYNFQEWACSTFANKRSTDTILKREELWLLPQGPWADFKVTFESTSLTEKELAVVTKKARYIKVN